MDELVDELSYAMIGVDVDETSNNNINGSPNDCNHKVSFDKDNQESTKDTVMKTVKSHKPVTRSASILIRSKLLILSDSESEDESANAKINGKMSLLGKKMKQRLSKKKDKLRLEQERQRPNPQLNTNSSDGLTGKRKRSSTISDGCSSGAAGGHSTTQMECDESDSSSLSETPYNSDVNCDGDDEQSDFYEVIAKSSKSSSKSRHNHHPRHEFNIPTRNPFMTMGLSSPGTSNSTASSIIWKRRRRMH